MASKTASRKTPGNPKAATAAPPRVGVIGLGIMGSAMAANLVKAGFEVYGCDPVAAARKGLQRAGGIPCDNATEVARQCRHLVLSLPSVAALEQVARELIAAKAKGLVAAETSTLPETAKVQVRDTLAAAGITLLDCPLSGTGAQARTRDLAVYASGDAKAIASMAAVFNGFARVRYDVGGFGNGIRMKLVANLLVAIHNQSAAEAILLGERSGLDPAQVVQVVADGAGGSRMLQVRGPMMVERSWGQATMKVEVWQKDMRLIHEALLATDTAAPLFAACVPIYNAAMALGHAQDDTAAVYSVLEHMMGAGPGKAGARRAPKRRKA
ncbi:MULTISPECIES: NAD(P)-dependent oxidoreductase [Ramlibacter]|uniref:NAD-binding protein n=1 Tax=Ramlibacter pinisoli TaxID=2682844 RepID=A0A6N8IPM9_9BURK|nr:MULTISPECIES: NAD(P)-dependent oxidoreductase [Ramlibacter]MBA2963137.1 NAD(P)-dependent oxidoreductase [Ramlibacter sp. CGMCC 1.13660]MVQ28106.1 NAD-binding protein [Ramlibacter pinisoli]